VQKNMFPQMQAYQALGKTQLGKLGGSHVINSWDCEMNFVHRGFVFRRVVVTWFLMCKFDLFLQAVIKRPVVDDPTIVNVKAV
jgi:hypothetical protein